MWQLSMTKSDLDPKTIDHFESKLNELLLELKPRRDRDITEPQEESSLSHVFVRDGNPNEIISFSSLGSFDGLGNELSRYFMADTVAIGLEGDEYVRFRQLMERLYEKANINSIMSLRFLKNSAFEWFEKQYKGQISRQLGFIEFLTQAMQTSKQTYKISIPISFLAIQEPFTVGNVVFEYYKKEFFDEYLSHAQEAARRSATFDERDFRIGEEKFRKKYQGLVFASLQVAAEKTKAIEIATDEAEKALMVLRFLSPSAFVPEIPCYFGLMGRTHLPGHYYFVFWDRSMETHEGIAESKNFIWHITKNHFSQRNLGKAFREASDLVTKKELSDLEISLMSSIHSFGRSLASLTFHDRIVYMTVAAETLLLQNENESIQANLSRRLAFLAVRGAQQRKEAIEVVRRAYKARSSYIHHGKVRQDMNLLKQLQHVVWPAIANTLNLRHQLSTRKDLCDYLEHLILS